MPKVGNSKFPPTHQAPRSPSSGQISVSIAFGGNTGPGSPFAGDYPSIACFCEVPGTQTSYDAKGCRGWIAAVDHGARTTSHHQTRGIAIAELLTHEDKNKEGSNQIVTPGTRSLTVGKVDNE